MTSHATPPQPFRIVRRGYDQLEVDAYINDLWNRAVTQERHPPSEMSKRLEQILELAREEADETRANADAEAGRIVAAAEVRAEEIVRAAQDQCDDVVAQIHRLTGIRADLLASLATLRDDITLAIEPDAEPTEANELPETPSADPNPRQTEDQATPVTSTH